MTYPLPGPDAPPPPAPPGPRPNVLAVRRVLRAVGLIADVTPGVLVAVAGCSMIGYAIGGVLWH